MKHREGLLSKDHQYLVSRGWAHTGTRQRGYKTIKYWAHPSYQPPPCGSFYQTDALILQKRVDSLVDLCLSK